MKIKNTRRLGNSVPSSPAIKGKEVGTAARRNRERGQGVPRTEPERLRQAGQGRAARRITSLGKPFSESYAPREVNFCLCLMPCFRGRLHQLPIFLTCMFYSTYVTSCHRTSGDPRSWGTFPFSSALLCFIPALVCNGERHSETQGGGSR